MMKSSYKLVLVLLIMPFLFFSCKGCPKKDEGEKVFRTSIPQKISGFDPVFSEDIYTSGEVARVYEGLLRYSYLRRPYALEPNLVEKMPEISEDGLVYTFTLRNDVKFHKAQCFEENDRRMSCDDVVYTLKRIADPHLKSPAWYLLKGKISGLDDWRDKNSKSLSTDYSVSVIGLQCQDQYHLRVMLNRNEPRFLYLLSMPYFHIVSTKAVEFFGKDFKNKAVGTGPFVLDEYVANSRIVYSRNPDYRDDEYPSIGEPVDKRQGLLKDKGAELPLLDKIVVNIISETQTAWESFLKGDLDIFGIPKDIFNRVVQTNDNLNDDLARKGIILYSNPSLDITYECINLLDPVLGGGETGRMIRQAMSLGYDRNEVIRLFYSNKAILAKSMIPPGIEGYDKYLVNKYTKFNLKKAKHLLAKAGFPQGKGLPEFVYETLNQKTAREVADFFKISMSKLGIRVRVSVNSWQDLQMKIKNGKAQIWGIGWGADYPDAENFLQLLYGANRTPGVNGANYENPEYDKLYEEFRKTRETRKRHELIGKMIRIANEDVPWILGVHRKTYGLKWPWLKNHKPHEFGFGNSRYYSIDNSLKKKLREE